MFDKPGLYATPYSTWHANAAISQSYFNEMFKNCYLLKTRAVKILHYTVHPSCDGIGISILSVNTAHKILLGECRALWGEPERVAGFHRKCLGKRLGHQMYVMPVFVEECSMGMCVGPAWIVHTVLIGCLSNHWSEIQGAWNSGIEIGMERWV